MALSLGSSPAIATNAVATTATVTSGSFTPAIGALVVPLWSGNTQTTTNPPASSITDNLAPDLLWVLDNWQSRLDTPNRDGQAINWHAFADAAAAMTVTVTNGVASGFRESALAVLSINGVDYATPVGASGKAGSASAGSIAQTYTATRHGSMGLLVVCDWSLTGAMSATGGTTLIGSANLGTALTYGFFRTATNNGVRGVTSTLNATMGGTSTDLEWVYLEILPELVPTRSKRRNPYSPLWRPGHPRRGRGFTRFAPTTASPAIVNRTATLVETASGTSVTGTLPADMVAGDLVVATFAMSSSVVNFTGPGGSWVTLAAPTSNATTEIVASYYQFNPSSGPTGTTTSVAGRNTVICQAYGNVDPVVPIDAAAVLTGGNTPLTLTQVTTSTAGSRDISGTCIDASTGTWSQPPGMTMVSQHTSGVGRGCGFADEIDLVPGATGTKQWVWSGTSQAAVGYLAALRPVAVGATVLDSGTDTSNVTAYSSGSISPVAGHVLLAFVQMTGIAGGVQTTVSGLGGTWTRVGSVVHGTDTDLSAHVGVGCTGTGTLTFTNADAGTSCSRVVIDAVGADPANPYVVGNVVTSAPGSVNTVNLPMAALPTLTGDRVFSAFGNNNTTAAQATPRTAWTELYDQPSVTPGAVLEVQWRPDIYESAASVDWVAGPYDSGGIAVEMRTTGGPAAGGGTPSTNASAECADATGAADDGDAAVAVNAECAAGTGLADNPTVSTASSTNAPAECATGTGAADQASVALTVTADQAAGTGVAGDAVAAVAVNAECATGTGVADDPTVSTASFTNAPAECATGTGAADNAVAALSVNAEGPAGTGLANDPSVTVAVAGGAVSGSGTADNAGPSVVVNADQTAGTGTAGDAVPALAVLGDQATGTGVAHDPTVSTASIVNALAECATGTGAADNTVAALAVAADQAAGTGAADQVSITVAVAGGPAAGTGAADNAGASVAAGADQATGTGAADQPSVTIAVLGDQASGTGVANDPTVSTASIVNASAECATGTGVADNVTLVLAALVAAEHAVGSGSVDNPVALLAVPGGVATGTGAADNATILTGAEPAPAPATGTGVASDGSISLRVFAEAAAGLGEAFVPSLVQPIIAEFDLGGSMAASSQGVEGIASATEVAGFLF